MLKVISTLVLIAACANAFESNQAAKVKLGHYFKDKYFLKDEGQSCPDISDTRSHKNDALIKFCLLPLPAEGETTALSFWGWDQLFGSARGKVQLYTEFEDKSKELVLDIAVPKNRNGRDVQFYYNEFTLSNTTNMKRLRLYYQVGGGGSKELNLRDVSDILFCFPSLTHTVLIADELDC
jgi:hypothetical protein